MGVRITPDIASSRDAVAHNADAADSRAQLRWAGVKKDTEWFWKEFLPSLSEIRPDIFIDFHLFWSSICITHSTNGMRR